MILFADMMGVHIDSSAIATTVGVVATNWDTVADEASRLVGESRVGVATHREAVLARMPLTTALPVDGVTEGRAITIAVTSRARHHLQ